jgi:hypothetical protein
MLKHCEKPASRNDTDLGFQRIPVDVRYWHKADIPSCTAHVRFTPKADMTKRPTSGRALRDRQAAQAGRWPRALVNMIPIRLQHLRLCHDSHAFLVIATAKDCSQLSARAGTPSVPNVPAPPWPLVAFPGGQGLLFPDDTNWRIYSGGAAHVCSDPKRT